MLGNLWSTEQDIPFQPSPSLHSFQPPSPSEDGVDETQQVRKQREKREREGGGEGPSEFLLDNEFTTGNVHRLRL